MNTLLRNLAVVAALLLSGQALAGQIPGCPHLLQLSGDNYIFIATGTITEIDLVNKVFYMDSTTCAIEQLGMPQNQWRYPDRVFMDGLEKDWYIGIMYEGTLTAWLTAPCEDPEQTTHPQYDVLISFLCTSHYSKE